MVRIVKPDDPWSKENDFFQTQNADVDSLEVRKIWRNIFKDKIYKDGFDIGG